MVFKGSRLEFSNDLLTYDNSILQVLVLASTATVWNVEEILFVDYDFGCLKYNSHNLYQTVIGHTDLGGISSVLYVIDRVEPYALLKGKQGERIVDKAGNFI